MNITTASPLYITIKSIEELSLEDADLEELLIFFKNTKSALIRDRLALIFSDLRYDTAVPAIMKAVRDYADNCGTLIYALEELDSKKYFLAFINIICTYNYEPRLMALNIIEKYASEITPKQRKRALIILEKAQQDLEAISIDQGENSGLHFIEQTILLLSYGNTLNADGGREKIDK